MDFKNGNITISGSWIKHMAIFFIEAVVVLSVVVAGVNYFYSLPHVRGCAIDSMSVANNFMVFVTFIVVIGTVAITMGGIYFTKEFARDKKLILTGNLQELKEEFLNNKDIRDQFIEMLLIDKKTIETIDERLNALSANRLEDVGQFKNEILKQQKDAMLQLENRLNSKINNLIPKDEEISELLGSFAKGKK